MFYGKLTRTNIPKILSVYQRTSLHPYKVKKNLQGSFFIIYEKSIFEFFINYEKTDLQFFFFFVRMFFGS